MAKPKAWTKQVESTPGAKKPNRELAALLGTPLPPYVRPNFERAEKATAGAKAEGRRNARKEGKLDDGKERNVELKKKGNVKGRQTKKKLERHVTEEEEEEEEEEVEEAEGREDGNGRKRRNGRKNVAPQKRAKVDVKESCSKDSSSSKTTALTSLENAGASPKACHSDDSVAREEDDESEGNGQRKLRSSSAGSDDVVDGSEGEAEEDEACYAKFVGAPMDKSVALAMFPERYQEDGDHVAVAHYTAAEVDGVYFEIGDAAEVKSEEAKNFVGLITEMFEEKDGSPYMCCDWFYFPEDTALGENGGDPTMHDQRRLFLSSHNDPNPLDCLVRKVSVSKAHPMVKCSSSMAGPRSEYYYDMSYNEQYSTFSTLPAGAAALSSQESNGSTATCPKSSASLSKKVKQKKESANTDLNLLDLYAGCGAMSTGLCSGAQLAGHNLISRWAIDINEDACKSYKYNHPETTVRNESADNFLEAIKCWQELCSKYSFNAELESKVVEEPSEEEDGSTTDDEDVFEVEKLLDIKYEAEKGLLFKVRWKGYDEEDDTWEPLENLAHCPERLKDFVVHGRKNRILPVPGEVDVICGGPPCQGASGFNRFRNYENPLADPRNHQMVVYMDIVNFLKPRFILMENVVDILKFCGGVLGKYALSRLVSMQYQAKIGLMVAGSYGLPQYRMRVFLWGASTMEVLPAFPLPTHDVVIRGHAPDRFKQNLVAVEDDCRLEKAFLLQDAISDLPPIDNYETRDEIPYIKAPETPFQKLVRLPKPGCCQPSLLFDHKPLIMNQDDLDRVCQIPKRKGANFRDLEGVIVLKDNTVTVKQENRKLLASGKPLVPDYAISFVKGKSSKPFGRLWWDQTVATVVTRAEPHNQAVLHPCQDRVLSIRENARLQGFPDHYKLFGETKERYKQVGNAVAVPVARALGYALGKAISGEETGPDFVLPTGFPMSLLRDGDSL